MYRVKEKQDLVILLTRPHRMTRGMGYGKSGLEQERDNADSDCTGQTCTGALGRIMNEEDQR